MILLGEEKTRELRSSGVSGEIEKSWSVGIMGIVYGGETEEEGEDEGKMCEAGEVRVENYLSRERCCQSP